MYICIYIYVFCNSNGQNGLSDTKIYNTLTKIDTKNSEGRRQ